VKLPAPPATLRLSETNHDTATTKVQHANAKLSEFQEELVWLSCSINGEAVPECPTVHDAAQYVLTAVTKFFDAAAAAKAGGAVDPNHILQL